MEVQYAILEQLCSQAPRCGQMGSRGRSVRHRVESDYGVQILTAAILACCIQQPAGC